tara:strand:+ start:6190 stop:8832 length:2643 start_codon:yes stop_codon:yes gene_type:complete
MADTSLRNLQTSFTSGELSPLMRMRSDLKPYFAGAKQLRNVGLYVSGGFSRRPGSIYKAVVADPTVLHEYSYTEGQDYVLAFYASNVKVFDDTGTLLITVSGAPWTAAQVKQLTITSSADTILIFHKDFWPQKLLRTDASTFVLSDLAFATHSTGIPVYQPFYKFLQDSSTMAGGATSGDTTLTCSESIFKKAHVGTIFRVGSTPKEVIVTTHTELITNGTFASDSGWTKGTGWTIGSGVATQTAGGSDSDLEQANAATNTKYYQVLFTLSNVTAGSISVILCAGTESAQFSANGSYEITLQAGAGSNIQFRADAAFAGSIDGVECFSAQVAQITVRETLANTDATVDWDEQTFSTVRGHPRCGCFHDQRLCLAGSTSRPDGFFASRVAEFFNFDVGTGLDAQAIDASIAASQVGEIRHILSSRNIQIYTNGGEIYVPQSQANPITPSNISFINQTPYGASQELNPMAYDGATLFLQKTGKVVREFLWQDTEQAYTSGAVSHLSSHLIKGADDGTILLGTDTSPEQYAMFVNNTSGDALEGTIAVFHSVRSEQLAGWTLWTTNGKYQSVAAVGNNLFATVKRTINGSDVVWLEKFDWDKTLDASISVDHSTDLVTNGAFTTDASWTKGTGWTIDGSDSNKATCSGAQSGNSDLEQASAAVNGTVYRVKFTVSGYTAGTLTPILNSGSGTAVSANGTYIQNITAGAGSNLQFRANATFAGSLDDVSVIKVSKEFTAAHLPSTSVEIVTNTLTQHAGTFTTSGSGVATTTEYLTNADVGLNYDISVETMPVDAVIKNVGPITGQKKRISRVVVSVFGTQSVSVSANKLILQQTNDDFTLPPTAVEGEYEFFLLGWAFDPTIVISQSEPLPLSVRGIYAEVTA